MKFDNQSINYNETNEAISIDKYAVSSRGQVSGKDIVPSISKLTMFTYDIL